TLSRFPCAPPLCCLLSWATTPAALHSLSLHDALPISALVGVAFSVQPGEAAYVPLAHQPTAAPEQLERDAVLKRLRPWLESESRSEEHTSELQSRENLVCRLLLEKKILLPKSSYTSCS